MSSALSRSMAVRVFLCFAFTYYLSALVRAITATLSPTLIPEFGLQSSDLGLLAGGYFLGFSLMQLPMGNWLDRHGPNKVILSFLVAAVLGCVAFACADSFTGLFLARILTGVGVSCCLMAPLTAYRRWFDAPTQMRANSWMLMTGSLGMLSSTLPVQWLLPMVGWRILFWAMAGMVLLSMVFIWWWVPKWETVPAPAAAKEKDQPWWRVYLEVWRHPYFRRMSPLGFFSYGGLVAMQTLWAGPWLNKVSGYTALEAATGLFWINVSMLLAFWGWGMVNPWLTRHGYTANRLIGWGVPFNLLAMLGVVWGRHRHSDLDCLFHHQHGGLFGSAGGGHGFPIALGGTRLVGLQPGGFCRCICHPMGHGFVDRCFVGRRMEHYRRLPRRPGLFHAVQPRRLRLFLVGARR
jgi:MFS family permease